MTRAVWWTLSEEAAGALAGAGVDLGGAAHAAEHASIGLLPLFATCDRWDIGGVSADLHPATGQLTVFVYDGHDGGAGFAERGFGAAADWLRATRQAIAGCDCEAGCPSCVQSPKCGNAQPPAVQAGRGRAAGHAAGRRGLRSVPGYLGACPQAPAAEKEAGAAGGESGARAHGPALGGETGPVLSTSLSAKCPRMRPPVSVSRQLVVYPPQVPVAASAQSELQHMPGGLARASAIFLPQGRVRPVTEVSLSKIIDLPAATCPQLRTLSATTANTASAPPVQP